ncbi:putative radical SAM domain protein [Plesiocystis pacifica SIR-1]|uniref:Putative radical SAM domain protein n=1 Tax=Plesiocystis pacifica SIR-1 TaxID=391625 RepID=A6FXT1_9BACT|nr:putative radical SAM domain protein [Plesiocystis pacifica SIR-1]
MVSVDELSQAIFDTPGIEGVTLTGGEPFEQAEGFGALADIVRARNMSVMIFTGYNPDEFDSRNQRRLVERCDILVAGRYVQSRTVHGQPWLGSANQQVHYLTDRYTPARQRAECEFHIHEDGRLVLTGFPAPELQDITPA